MLDPITRAGDGLMDQRVSDADSELSYIKDSLATMDLRLQTKEDLLRKQFTAMEQAIAASQSASSSLAGQLAGLSTADVGAQAHLPAGDYRRDVDPPPPPGASMNPYARPNAYRENSIMTASPEQLVVMLYDGAGRFLRQAEGSMIDGSWLQASEKLSRAEAIIDELLATLDMDAGEVADRLQSIYVFCKTRLIEARIERDAVRVDQVARLLGELREAWSQVRSPAVA